ncbi:unnamed protein product, partial [Prorocentrum cordatum]
ASHQDHAVEPPRQAPREDSRGLHEERSMREELLRSLDPRRLDEPRRRSPLRDEPRAAPAREEPPRARGDDRGPPGGRQQDLLRENLAGGQPYAREPGTPQQQPPQHHGGGRFAGGGNPYVLPWEDRGGHSSGLDESSLPPDYSSASLQGGDGDDKGLAHGRRSRRQGTGEAPGPPVLADWDAGGRLAADRGTPGAADRGGAAAFGLHGGPPAEPAARARGGGFGKAPPPAEAGRGRRHRRDARAAMELRQSRAPDPLAARISADAPFVRARGAPARGVAEEGGGEEDGGGGEAALAPTGVEVVALRAAWGGPQHQPRHGNAGPQHHAATAGTGGSEEVAVDAERSRRPARAARRRGGPEARRGGAPSRRGGGLAEAEARPARGRPRQRAGALRPAQPGPGRLAAGPDALDVAARPIQLGGGFGGGAAPWGAGDWHGLGHGGGGGPSPGGQAELAPGRQRLLHRLRRVLQQPGLQPRRQGGPRGRRPQGEGAPEGLSSLGASLHRRGECTPCKFIRSLRGCRDGSMCMLCHEPHEELSRSAVRKAARTKGLLRRSMIERAEVAAAPWLRDGSRPAPGPSKAPSVSSASSSLLGSGVGSFTTPRKGGRPTSARSPSDWSGDPTACIFFEGRHGFPPSVSRWPVGRPHGVSLSEDTPGVLRHSQAWKTHTV